MNRKEREMEDVSDIMSVIQAAKVCRLAITGEEYPYIVPLCFGYKDNTLYFHSAEKGMKTDLLKKNPKVCFETDVAGDVRYLSKICNWGMDYKSVIGFGDAEFVESDKEKKEALDIIVLHYAPELPAEKLVYPAAMLKNTLIIKVRIRSMTGKKSG